MKNKNITNKIPILNIILYPHRSLSPKGFLILMLCIIFVSFSIGAFFMLKGAWPVFGFFGLDVLLVYIAFKVNYHNAKRYEKIRLWENSLIIKKKSDNGKSNTWKFNPYWVRLEMKKSQSRSSDLNLSSHGKTISIGSFLSNQEKEEVANTLLLHLKKLRVSTTR
ncbi:MAG: DUF2244 domain-containing protein [Alphaproteobacteria bacterium]|nr:DUF2244 domain-containing protein [Alphaproteobacteria bacterium]PPR39568.1 MAG: hypothetical protein CFH29_00288 [Alphaproteobacteria bacterium MarineAlpha7_Bin1]